MYGLCIKLFIINRRAINRSCHIDDNIASAAGSIGQQIFMITGSDERSVPTHLLSSCTAWSSDVDNRFLENMFQKCLLICLVLIKFVHIDKQETIERQLCIPFVTEINSVGIVCLQFGWNQTPAKSRFSVCLRTNKQRNCAVCIFPVYLPPMCHHIQEPTIKQIGPVRIVARYPGCQFTYSVVSVPVNIQSEKKVFDRIENRDAVRIQIADYIPVPQIESFQSCVHGNAVPDAAA